MRRLGSERVVYCHLCILLFTWINVWRKGVFTRRVNILRHKMIMWMLWQKMREIHKILSVTDVLNRKIKKASENKWIKTEVMSIGKTILLTGGQSLRKVRDFKNLGVNFDKENSQKAVDYRIKEYNNSVRSLNPFLFLRRRNNLPAKSNQTFIDPETSLSKWIRGLASSKENWKLESSIRN